MKVLPFGPLEPALYREVVRRALAEDMGWGDITTEAAVGTEQRARGSLLARSRCVLAGLDVACEAFRQLDPVVAITRFCHDGETCEPGTDIAHIAGFAAALLTAERTALNFLQHLSGIATLTRRFVEVSGGRITILDTRKTIPTLRALQKYAVRAGGGVNHRASLDDGILVKENHIALAGGMAAAVARLKARRHEMPLEVEAQTLEEVDQALEARADIILLDNMTTDMIVEAVRRTRGRAKVEISGGVTLKRLPELAATGAEYVSIGALTHSVQAADISFEIEPE